MGIRDRIKRKLPILGSGGNTPVSTDSGSSMRPAAEKAEAPVWTPPPTPKSPRGDQPVQEYLKEFTSENPLVLFMKGNPGNPQCGFSARASAILQSYGHDLAHFDVFLDPEVRNGVKEFSEWPTLPQVYLGGEFLGGSDILQQMHDSGELRELIDATCSDSKSE